MPTQPWRWLIALALPIALKAGDVHLIQVSSAGGAAEINVSALPLRVGDWVGVEQHVVSQAVAPLARDAVVQREYERADGTAVTVALIYSNKWEGLHPPEHCLVAGGWKVVRETTVDLTYGADHRRARANIVTAQKPPGGELVELYLFADAKKTTATWIQQYAELMTRHGRSGGQASCLLLVSHQGEKLVNPQDSMAIVKDFTEVFLPHVHRSLEP